MTSHKKDNATTTTTTNNNNIYYIFSKLKSSDEQVKTSAERIGYNNKI